ncbi:hypothetical protein ACOSQ4_014884 [Xanthoceras sorbifolium]
MFPLPSFLILSLSWRSAASGYVPGKFLQCLQNHSQQQPTDHPLSTAIYTQQNSSYSSKPLLILTALHETHVQAAIFCAQKHGLQMKIRSGGHDYEGLSYISKSSKVPFFLLDMFKLRYIDVDLQSESAWVQAGATLGEVFYKISEKSRIHGFPAGVCPTVGVGGHFSGGGYGNMMRKHGLSVDNIIDAKLVDVNGRILDRKSMGEAMFWAIRGGGAASFGVVIAYRIKLFQVPETVTVFRVEKTLEENATEIVYAWQEIAHKLHEDLFIRLILEAVNSGTRTTKKTIRASFHALFLGNSERLLSIMNENFPELGLARSDCIESSWIESVLYWTSYYPPGTPADFVLRRTPPTLTFLKRKSDYVKKPIQKKNLSKIWKKMIELETPYLIFNPYGGKMWEIPEKETPFPHRAGNLWKIQYLATWKVAGVDAEEHHINLIRKLYNYMTPYVSRNPRAAYFNYRDVDLGINNHHGKESSYLQGKAYGIKYFKRNFKRLVEIKTRVDPENFFRNEQSIPVCGFCQKCPVTSMKNCFCHEQWFNIFKNFPICIICY